MNLFTRFSADSLREALTDSPVILIHGSRQCGKTTLAQQLGAGLGYAYVSFDDLSHVQSAKADPVGYVQQLPPRVILDEIQRVPELFTSLKARVDQARTPGQLLLTGSANVLLLPHLADSLAGRMEIVQLRPLSCAEIAGQRPDFFTAILSGALWQSAPRQYARLGPQMAERLCTGGYPAAVLRASEKRRSLWYRDYLQTLLQRDIQDISKIHNLAVMPRLLTLAAGQTARLFVASDLAAPFALSRPTISQYLGLLAQMFLLELLPPWHSNRLSRLIKTPKMHLADTGLACALLGVSSKTLWQDKPLLGQLLETFVYQELRKYADWYDEPLGFFHFRTKDQVEVDIVIEAGRRLLGIEVKAAASVTQADFKGLLKLKEACPEQFAGGVVFYDGESLLPFGDKLVALPLRLLMPEP
jgi:uncharacterized protein